MCKNQYQSWSDWWHAQWTCPRCRHAVSKPWTMCDNLSLATMEHGKTSYRLECTKCGFMEPLEPVDFKYELFMAIDRLMLRLGIVG